MNSLARKKLKRLLTLAVFAMAIEQQEEEQKNTKKDDGDGGLESGFYKENSS